jgi:hypothetical protein
MRSRIETAVVAILPCTGLVLALSAGRLPPAPAARVPVNGGSVLDSTMWTTIRNVDLRVASKADAEGSLRVRTLRGRVFETHPGRIPFLDDPESFGIDVTSGTVALDGPGLTALLTERVFNYKGSPIRSLRVSMENGQLVQRGVMHKGVDLRFQMWSTVTMTEDGRIRSHPTRLILMGVNGITLLHALGLKMEKVMDVSGTRGIIEMQGDDMILDPLRMMPPPVVRGRIATVKIEGDEIVQTFASSPEDSMFNTLVRVDPSVHNYVYYKGASLRFGRLTMTPTDLLIGDADESDRFDLDLQRYNEQLTAGYTRTLENNALRTWMPDRHDLKAGRVAPPVLPTDTRNSAPMRPPR